MAFADLNENNSLPGIESWSFGSFVRDYRKVATLGLLAGLIAFMGSFIVPPTYAAGTRVLIRGRDSTLLASSGESLGSSGGAILDSQLAASLTETQAGLLNTRTVAVEIVDRLNLDAPVDNSGFVGQLKVIGVQTYLRSRAYITHGFYREIPTRERVIGQVQGELGAEQIEDSYVLEIVGVWEEPELAAAIANTAADIMVEQSVNRSSEESLTYRDFLADQVAIARDNEQTARIAVADFSSDNEILNIDELLALSSRSVQTLDDEIDRSRADLESVEARVRDLQRSLAETSPTSDQSESITTGRSTTQIDSTGQNPTYVAIETELQQTRAEQAGTEARLAALVSARDGAVEGSTGDLSEQEAELRILLLDQRIAEDSLEELNGALRVASINASRPQVEVLRLDEAAVPTYPVGPKRYLYLGIGTFIGGLVGFLWSFLGLRRRAARDSSGGTEVEVDNGSDPDGDGQALLPSSKGNLSRGRVVAEAVPVEDVEADVVRERVPVGATLVATGASDEMTEAMAEARDVADSDYSGADEDEDDVFGGLELDPDETTGRSDDLEWEDLDAAGELDDELDQTTRLSDDDETLDAASAAAVAKAARPNKGRGTRTRAPSSR